MVCLISLHENNLWFAILLDTTDLISLSQQHLHIKKNMFKILRVCSFAELIPEKKIHNQKLSLGPGSASAGQTLGCHVVLIVASSG